MTRRSERVAEAIRRLTSEIVRTKLHDSRIRESVTITKVEIAEDLRYAKIFYTAIGDEQRKMRVKWGLEGAKGFIKKQLAEDLGLRYAPDIVFKVDKSAEHSGRIDEILGKIHREAENENNNKSSASD